MKRAIIFLFLSILFLAEPFVLNAEYDAKGPLRVKRIEFCKDKPKGLGNFELRKDNEFIRGDDIIYIYVEVTNCKPEKVDQFYHIRLAMDIGIYYEDGICIYSEEDANIFDYQHLRRKNDAYIWAKIDAAYLKDGEYKVEMTIRDENSDKEAFALTKFKRLSTL